MIKLNIQNLYRLHLSSLYFLYILDHNKFEEESLQVLYKLFIPNSGHLP